MAIIDELVSILGYEIKGQENLRDFKRGMSDAEKGAKGLAQGITSMARGAVAGMAALGAAVAGATGSMFALANAAAGPLDELGKAADRAGVSFEALQELGFAAEQSGSSVGELSNAVEMMSRRLAEAARGQGRAKTALEAYGLSATDAEGNVKSATDFMSELADTFQDLSAAEWLDLGQQLGLSRGLITMLAQGNEEIERLRQTARDAGLIFTDEDARNAEAYNDAMNLLMRSVRAMRDRIAIDLLPTLMTMIGGMQEWLSANREVIQQNVGAALERIARHARTLSEHGADMVEALKGWEPLLIALARVLFPTAFAIGLLVLAFDDFMTWWSGGGESFLGAFSDWLSSFSLISEGMADTITGIALGLGLFAALKPGAFLRMVGGLWRLSGVALAFKALGAVALFRGIAGGITAIGTASLIALGKVGLFAAAVYGLYRALRALKDAFPDSELFRPDPSHGPRSRPGEIGPNADRPFDPADPLGTQRPPPGPQSMGTQGPETFAERFAQLTDNRDQSTRVEVGGITVNTMSENGSQIANEVVDALQRRAATISGNRPVSP